MRHFSFSSYNNSDDQKPPFEKLLDIFTQLLTYTNGDYSEAIQWLTELDKEYKLTSPDYGIGDFIEELKDKGYLSRDSENGTYKITPKTEQTIRKKS